MCPPPFKRAKEVDRPFKPLIEQERTEEIERRSSLVEEMEMESESLNSIALRAIQRDLMDSGGGSESLELEMAMPMVSGRLSVMCGVCGVPFGFPSNTLSFRLPAMFMNPVCSPEDISFK